VGRGFGVPSSLSPARNSNFGMFKKNSRTLRLIRAGQIFSARRRKLSLCGKINEFPLKTIFSWKRVFMVAIFYFYFIVKKSYLPNALCDRLEITLIRSEIMKHYIVKNYFVSHLFCLNVNRSWDIREKRFFTNFFVQWCRRRNSLLTKKYLSPARVMRSARNQSYSVLIRTLGHPHKNLIKKIT
jgi:hypothetical protein